MLFNTILKRSVIPLTLYECVSNDIRSTLRLWSGHHVANNLLYSFIECTGEEYRAIAVTVGNGDAFLGWHERWRRFDLARRRQEGWHDIESRRMGSKSGSGKRVASASIYRTENRRPPWPGNSPPIDRLIRWKAIDRSTQRKCRCDAALASTRLSTPSLLLPQCRLTKLQQVARSPRDNVDLTRVSHVFLFDSLLLYLSFPLTLYKYS